MAEIQLNDICKSFGKTDVIHNVDIDIDDGEFVVFVGPSGCGKSTLLRLIAGLEDITSGELSISNRVVNDFSPKERGIAMVFQSYALYPHLTVYQNMAFGLKIGNKGKEEVKKRVLAAADALQLTDYLKRRPAQLSGGQRQRVAIGRAIVRKPEVFLFDEPLSNLDAALRVQTRLEIAKLHQDLKTTIVYVTHDQVEAMTLADKIVVLRNGRVEQVGVPLELYHNPANVFVAGFIGSPKMNFIRGEIKHIEKSNCEVKLECGESVMLELDVDQKYRNEKVTIGIRPEHLVLDGENRFKIKSKVEVAEHLGDITYIYSKQKNNNQLIISMAGTRDFKVNDDIEVSAPLKHIHLFNENGERL